MTRRPPPPVQRRHQNHRLPHGKIVSASKARRARGVTVEGHTEGTGAVPPFVPEGAEFDYEQAHGYRTDDARLFTEVDNPWAAIPPDRMMVQLSERELRLGDAPWEEHEEWDDLIPLKPRVYPFHPDLLESDPVLGWHDDEIAQEQEEHERVLRGMYPKAMVDAYRDMLIEQRKEAEERNRRWATEQKTPRQKKRKKRKGAGRTTPQAKAAREAARAERPLPPPETAEDSSSDLGEELMGWPEPAPVEITVYEDVEPVDEPEIQESAYARAMRERWGAA